MESRTRIELVYAVLQTAALTRAPRHWGGISGRRYRVGAISIGTQSKMGLYFADPGAGEGNRTPSLWMGTRSSTFELHPHEGHSCCGF